MIERSIQFKCPQCGFTDFGRYCSHCGNKLQLAYDQVPGLLGKWLIDTGYVQLAGYGEDQITEPNTESPHSHPAWFPKSLARNLLSSTVNNNCSATQILVFDRTNLDQVEILVLIPSEQNSFDKIEKLVSDIRSILVSVPKDLRKQYRIKNIIVSFYLLGFSTEVETQAKQLKSIHKSIIRFGRTFSISFIGLSFGDAKTTLASAIRLDPEKNKIIRSLLAQTNIESTLEQTDTRDGFWSTVYSEILLKPTEALQKLAWIFSNVVTKPMFYASEIDQGRLNLGTALWYLALLVVFVFFIEQAAGLKEVTATFDIFPIVNEALAFLWYLLWLVLFSGLFFAALKVFRGTGTFKKTLIAQIVLMTVFLPVATVIDVVYYLIDSTSYIALTTSGMSQTPGVQSQNGLTLCVFDSNV